MEHLLILGDLEFFNKYNTVLMIISIHPVLPTTEHNPPTDLGDN